MSAGLCLHVNNCIQHYHKRSEAHAIGKGCKNPPVFRKLNNLSTRDLFLRHKTLLAVGQKLGTFKSQFGPQASQAMGLKVKYLLSRPVFSV